MKKLFTLAATAALGLASLAATAQTITVDGQLTTAEVSSSGYLLVGRYTGAHGFAPSATNSAGLLSLYAAADASNLYFFVAGTLQNDGNPATISNSIQVLIARPGVTGVPVGTALPVPASGGTTSFQSFAPYLDQVGDMGFGVKGNGTAAQVQFGGVVYTGGTTPSATAAVLATGVSASATAATTATVSGQTGSLTVFNGAQMAYRTATSLNANPGFSSGGNAPATGLEIAVSRASIGLASAGGTVRLFALQNNQDGSYVSTDFIPQSTNSATAANPGTNPDFRAIPGTQSVALTIGPATGVTVLATKAADAAAVALSVYPNPVADAASVVYRVTDQSSPVSIVLTDLMGRTVRVLENSVQPVGSQSVAIKKNDLAAGTYLVRVQVGEKVSTSKIAVL